jgi:predicted  nucleic acid-binding Zn-ribbon protein
MEDKNWIGANIWYLIGAMALGFLLMRILPVGRLLLVALLFIVPIAVLVYFLYQRFGKKAVQRKKSKEQAALAERINQCNSSITQLKKELRDIDKSLSELQREIGEPESLPRGTLAKTQSLISSFKKEKELRLAKIRFYQSCREKLEMLYRNHDLTRSLQSKMDQLKKLKESHYEELADMESMRSDLSYQQGFFETFDQLSLRVLNTESISDTELLHEELEKMVDEI